MINYNSISSLSLRSAIFSIPFGTLGTTTSYNFIINDGLQGYIIPVSFLVYNGTNDIIDKVLFRDSKDQYNFTHEQTVNTSGMKFIGPFNQGPPAPDYNTASYSVNQMFVQWSNLGHTYTSGSLYIKIVYYISKKFW